MANQNLDTEGSLGELYSVAHMYYELGMRQSEIADKMFYSRSKVCRLLAQAKEQGIVQITIKKIYSRVDHIEKKLCSEFGLREAFVVSSYGEEEKDSLDALTDIAAKYISDRIRGNYTMGITRGNTINSVISKLTKEHEAKLHVIQLTGSVSSSYYIDESQMLVNKLLDKFGGYATYINAPIYLSDLYAKNVMMQNPSLSSAMEMIASCNLIVAGIGPMNDGQDYNHVWNGFMLRNHVDELLAQKAVGFIGAQYYDINGIPIECEWNTKCFSISLEELKRTRESIGIAYGHEKVRAITGAMRGGLISKLFTDLQTANEILKLNEKT